MIFTAKFWMDVAERSLFTFVETLLAVLTFDAVSGSFSTGWDHIVSIAGIAAFYAVLKGVLASRVGSERTAAILPAGPDTDRG